MSLKNIGQQKYYNFVWERLLGDKSIWDPLSKEKVPALVNNNTATINKKLISFQRRKETNNQIFDSDTDLLYYLDIYKFSV